MQLDEILQRNRRYTKGRPPRALPAPERIPLIVLTCFDPRLDDMLLPALGLGSDQAFLYRTAGAYAPPDSATLRSLIVGALLLESKQIVVMGHTSCRMAQFETSTFIDTFRARGVSRDAFGSQDLREWAGAIPSPRRGVELSVHHIMSEPARPQDLSVSGLLLDDTRGSLDVVVEGGAEADSDLSGNDDQPDPDAVEVKPPLAVQEVDVDDPLESAINDLAGLIRSNAKWRYESQRLRRDLASDKHPAAKLRSLSSFAKRAGADVAEIMKAFERVRSLASTADGSLDTEALAALFPLLVAKL